MARGARPVPDRASRHAPLESVAWPPGIREIPFLTQLSVRVDPADANLLRDLADHLGFPLDLTPNAISGNPDGRHALWLGPDEWLVVGPQGAEEELMDVLRQAGGGRLRALTDVSASRTTIELRGSRSRETLEAGCPIDLHPRSFGPRQCAQTVIARTFVILTQVSDEPRYRLLVRVSFATYLAAWLMDAMAGVELESTVQTS
jgi:sarcosine oxidase, subunit gamma